MKTVLNSKKPDLLILGAGGHGHVVKDAAEASGLFRKIDFLDDNSSDAIGKINDYPKFAEQYKYAFVGIGNNIVRRNLLEDLENSGFIIATIIHPTAYVCKSAVIGPGTVVEPNASVNTNAVIGKGCIISIGSIIDHDAVVEDYCHVNAGAICKAGSHINKLTKLEAGQVVIGY